MKLFQPDSRWGPCEVNQQLVSETSDLNDEKNEENEIKNTYQTFTTNEAFDNDELEKNENQF